MGFADKYTHKYHPQPRLSANQVGDYLSANATNRRRILKEAKYPPTLLLIRYEEAKTALIAHLTSGVASGSSVLDRKLLALRRTADDPSLTDYKRANCNLCIDAIDAFQGHEPRMAFGRMEFSRPASGLSKLKIGGVSVSVSLDFQTQKRNSKGERLVGGAILVFSKAKGSELIERCKTTTLLIQELLNTQVKSGETIDPTLCMAIDVFNGLVYRAKSQQRQLYKTVENSCGEVATVWPSIPPPENYNGPPVPEFL